MSSLGFASSPKRCPIFNNKSVSNVAPITVAQDRQAAGMPSKNRVPRVRIMWISGSNNDQLGDTQAVIESQLMVMSVMHTKDTE
jgi:hypothetical protein